MDIIAKFQSHAEECRRMARFARDLESTAVWNRMAERWANLAASEQARNKQRSETRPHRAGSQRPRAA
jgi:hypothetical protein